MPDSELTTSHLEIISVHDGGYVRLVDHMGDDLSVVNAARVSYDKESDQFSNRDDRLLNFLIHEGHTSPLRHAALTYEVYAPLLVARQWWKYAVSSTHVDDINGWNESSRRYVTENEEFHIPKTWRYAPDNSKQGSGADLPQDDSIVWSHRLFRHIEESEKLYRQALQEGIAPEQARLFLPAYSLYVRWRWTTSLAAVLHFLDQRLAHDAQKEIQDYAQAVYKLTRQHFPNVFSKVLDESVD